MVGPPAGVRELLVHVGKPPPTTHVGTGYRIVSAIEIEQLWLRGRGGEGRE